MSKLRLNLIIFSAIVGGICLGIAGVGVSQQGAVSALAPPVTHSPSDLSTAFREVSDRVLPAVVSISTVTKSRVMEQTRNFSGPEEELFRRFFGNDDRFNEMFQQPRRTPKQMGAGSGFIVNPDGIIMTNSHVVEGADKVTVRLADGREVEADSWDFDPRSDVAVVRITVDEKLPFLSLGNSDDMQIGDWVLALGNPLNVGTTVTAGIISATERAPGINEREDYIQTDAAINPGNSGGPLVNLHGEVIGINTAISTRSGGYDGIGFAIPATMARWIADQLIEDGTVDRSYLGVQLYPLSSDIREAVGAPVGQGAFVAEVLDDTPAERAGLKPQDVILEFAGQKISDRDELVDIVERSKPGKNYDALILREGKQQTVKVKLEKMPSGYTPALKRVMKKSEEPEKSDNVAMDAIGIEVVELSDELSQQLGLDDEEVSGIVIRSVKSDSLAEDAGLRPGDIIQRVGTINVSTIDEFGKALGRASLSKGVLMQVNRRGENAFVVIKSDE